MKRFHEVAHIKDGNKIVGYIVKEGTAQTNSPYLIMTYEQFKKAVSSNSVQYFMYKNGDVVIEYTEEEKSELGAMNFPLFTGKDYYRNDISYKVDDIDNLLNRGRGILKAMTVLKMPVFGEAIGCSLFAPKSEVKVFLDFLQSISALNSVWGNTIRVGGNWVSFTLPLIDFNKNSPFMVYTRTQYTLDTVELTRERDVKAPMQVTDAEELKKFIKLFR